MIKIIIFITHIFLSISSVGFSSPTHRSEASSSNTVNPTTPTIGTPGSVPMSPGGVAPVQGPAHLAGNAHQQPHSLENTVPQHRMFGDTLHLHRNSNKQVEYFTIVHIVITLTSSDVWSASSTSFIDQY